MSGAVLNNVRACCPPSLSCSISFSKFAGPRYLICFEANAHGHMSEHERFTRFMQGFPRCSTLAAELVVK